MLLAYGTWANFRLEQAIQKGYETYDGQHVASVTSDVDVDADAGAEELVSM